MSDTLTRAIKGQHTRDRVAPLKLPTLGGSARDTAGRYKTYRAALLSRRVGGVAAREITDHEKPALYKY